MKDLEKELIVNSSGESVEIAILEDRKLIELHQEKLGNSFNVGDIFVGVVEKTMPGLNAAFVNIGHPKEAFLHYTDCGPTLASVSKYTNGVMRNRIGTSRLDNFMLEPDIDKRGTIDQVLKKGDSLLVQVLKEPISTKGPRLSCEMTIPGRFVVISPFKNIVAVSKKISTEEERTRLKNVIESIKPKNFGVIVRTAAEGKKVADLHEDILQLMEKWDQVFAKTQRTRGHAKVLKELDKTESLLRDILNESYGKIVVNDPDAHGNLKEFLGSIAKDKVKILSQYNGKRPIFDHFGVTRQIKSSFGRSFTMKSGAYLVIEHTEAMHVIDVNSGPKSKDLDQESAALTVNLEAAEEIARQLKLRDLGGLIIIDFIDMRSSENKSKLVKALKRHMSNDRAQHTILPLSKFGLIQITRQRTRPELKIKTAEVCPGCGGTGSVKPTLLITDDIERDLETIYNTHPKGKFTLRLHPFVHAFLACGLISRQMRWAFKYMKWTRMMPDADYGLTQYKFFDENNDEIRLN